MCIRDRLPLGFVESAQYPQATLNKLPSLIEKQQKTVERIESEIPILQDIVGRQWSKADELVKLKLECKELQRKIDESLKDAERSLTPVSYTHLWSFFIRHILRLQEH